MDQTKLKELEALEINPNAGTGISPKDYVQTPGRFTIRANDDGFPIDYEDRKPNKGGGEFRQFTLFLRDANGVDGVLRFLFERHIAPLAAAYGKSPLDWIDKEVVLRGEAATLADGKVVYNPVLEPDMLEKVPA